MSATVHVSAHPWASAHRALLTVLAVALALTVAVTIAFLVSRATTGETIRPAPAGEIEIVPDGCRNAMPGTAC
jgi:hypothetical protein